MRPLRRAGRAYGRWNRQRKLTRAIQFAELTGAKSVLLVGVDATSSDYMNVIEQGLAATVDRAVGISTCSATCTRPASTPASGGFASTRCGTRPPR